MGALRNLQPGTAGGSPESVQQGRIPAACERLDAVLGDLHQATNELHGRLTVVLPSGFEPDGFMPQGSDTHPKMPEHELSEMATLVEEFAARARTDVMALRQMLAAVQL